MEKVSSNLYYGIYTCSLLSSVINNARPMPLPQDVNIQKLYEFQERQSVANMAYVALKQLDIPDEQLKEYSDDYKMMLLREARFEIVGQQVFSALEKAEIPYIPLKGAVVKSLYPQESLRSFTDYDIYIAGKDKQADAVMKKLGFTAEKTSDHDTKYTKKPSLSFEMHRKFFGETSDFYGYFDKPFKLASLKEGSNYCCILRNEEMYIHSFCHMYKHYSGGGCGLRHFLDLYVMRKKLVLDFDYVEAVLKKLRLYDFYKVVNRLNAFIFDGEKPDRDILDICEYIFSTGTFGVAINNYISDYNKDGGNIFLWKIKYFIRRWGLTYSAMKEKYVILKKLPVLLPFCWGHKAFTAVFFRGVLKSQISDMKNINSRNSDYLSHIWKISGIDKRG